MTRDEAARAFAEKMGLGRALVGERGDIIFTGDSPLAVDHVPAPDADLPSMLEFVGRVAVAIGARAFKVESDIRNKCSTVSFEFDGWFPSPVVDDLCHAALLAALAALESR